MYLYGYGNSEDTIARIADILKCDYGTRPNGAFLVINWGEEEVPNKYKNVLNRRIYLDKFEAQEILSKKVRTPKTWTSLNAIPPKEFPVLGRDRHHSQGKDIVFIKNEEGVRKDHYVQFIDKKAEVRAHVLGKKVFLSKRAPRYKGSGDKIIWNTSHGYAYKDVGKEDFSRLTLWLIKRVARKAVKALKYDFGAVDIVISDGFIDKAWVLEVNSAPGLIYKRAKWYADYFKEVR